MIKNKNLFSVLVIGVLILLSSCGTLTPMRYSRGFKSNLAFNFSKKEKVADRQVAAKAVKKSGPQQKEVRVESLAYGQLNGIEKVGDENTELSSKVSDPSYQKNGKVGTIKHPLKTQIINDSIPAKPAKPAKLPYEPHVKWAGILFFGGLILGSVLPFVGIATIIGFFLALKGRRLIDESEGEFRGRGMANTIITLVIIGAVLTIITVGLVIALLLM